MGLSVSKRVGSAVVRNKVRRRLTEVYASLGDCAPFGDCVVIARTPASKASYQIMEKELRSLFAKAAGLRA